MQPNETTGLLVKQECSEERDFTGLNREDSILPEFILASIDTMTEAVEEIAHDITTFEPLETDSPHVRRLSTNAEREESDEFDPLAPLVEATEPTEPRDSTDPFESHEKLGLIPLAVMIFYNVSGGPFGCETSVRAGGNFYALMGFLCMPLVWSVQEALMTAELGTAFPEASGGVAWVEEAFGSNAGWMTGYLGWIAGATDNAIYPVLFLDYLLQAMHHDRDDINVYLRFFLLTGTSISLGYVNWLGLPLVGKMSVSICMVAMSPFIILVLVGAFKVDPSRWFERPQESAEALEDTADDDIAGGLLPNAQLWGILWRPFLNNLFWNLNSFDAVGSFAADIDNPATVLPKAMAWSVVIVVACYFIPLLVAIGATDARQDEWTDGFLARIASDVVGPWLGAWTVFAAGISNIALFQAELSADAFQLMGMADRGHLPKIFSRRSKHGTPTYGIILGTAVIVVMGVSNLDELIEMLNFNYAIALVLEYCAFIKLRISRPDLERPYRVPLNTTGCILMLIPTFIFTLIILMLATYRTLALGIGVNIVGVCIFHAKTRSEVMRRACACGEKNVYKKVDSLLVDVSTNGEVSTAPDSASDSTDGEVTSSMAR